MFLDTKPEKKKITPAQMMIVGLINVVALALAMIFTFRFLRDAGIIFPPGVKDAAVSACSVYARCEGVSYVDREDIKWEGARAIFDPGHQGYGGYGDDYYNLRVYIFDCDTKDPYYKTRVRVYYDKKKFRVVDYEAYAR